MATTCIDIDLICQAYINTTLAHGNLGHGRGPPHPSDFVSNNIRPGGHPTIATATAHSQPTKIIQQQQQ